MSSIGPAARWLLLVVAPLIAGTRSSEACSCNTGIAMCERFWRTAAVFSAVVLDITPEQDRLRDRTVRLQVEQAWRGGVSGTIEVGTGTGGGDCGYDFTRGERYLVYADQRGGLLFVPLVALASAACRSILQQGPIRKDDSRWLGLPAAGIT